jgi:hypothetical protein
MKLKKGCMDKILFFLQCNLKVTDQIDCSQIINGFNEHYKQYSDDDVWYSIIKLKEAGFIDSPISIISDSNGNRTIINSVIYDITLSGHERLSQTTNG